MLGSGRNKRVSSGERRTGVGGRQCEQVDGGLEMQDFHFGAPV